MQLSTILTFTVALLAGHALASPELQKRTTCQACSVAGIEGGAACCSAHCVALGNIHGGHCDDEDYCICN
ncbi:uncharacterized protein EURHEDRAFT_377391 [Aspergillus ruber CBS 135680]|uniref:Invertebrate defensins family profile domain-containing protein n=1 Tax=Aspergillus ruber (strain CBS 135680) TaxID=1388766 RepID=A0A017SE53_ASPRC|nr:uncharacterized protein EURHEDRAFT_377391 [Aspergillus ruber CBS 135680]EYE95303.1 hypothetical protein EURHEDRAFT_377391 [Aspergillus ruber CBS 135680]